MLGRGLTLHMLMRLAAVWSAGVMLYVMLFCKYPFERKGDDKDPQKFQKILERIQRVSLRLLRVRALWTLCCSATQCLLALTAPQRCT